MHALRHIGGRAAAFLAPASVFAAICLTSLHSYLLFHSLAEVFAIVVAVGVFMFAWNSRRYHDNDYLLFIGIGYLFVAGLDLLHTLSYDGMGVFPAQGSNLATQLWLAARYTQALALLAAPLFLRRPLRPALGWLGFGSLTLALIGAIFVWEIFPTAYVEGQGLTTFKVVSEYAISAAMLVATLLLYINRRAFDKQVRNLLTASLVTTALSEIAFTLYVGAYDVANLAGHALKLIAVFFLYRAIVQTGLVRPYSLLFRNLKRVEDRYRDLFEDAPVMYVTLDFQPDEPIITDCNDLFLETLGYERQAVIGRPLADFYTEESREQMVNALGQAHASALTSGERQLTTRTGEVVHALLQLSTQDTPEGSVDVRAAFVNISDRIRAERAEQEEHRFSEALTDVTSILNSTLDVDTVLDQILAHVDRVVPHDAANIMLLDGDAARVVRHRGYDAAFQDSLAGMRFNICDAPLLQRAIETRSPLIVEDTLSEPLWRPTPVLREIRAYAVAPICQDESVIGFINLDSRQPGAFSPHDAARLMAFANSASSAIRNAQVYRQAEEAREQAERADRTKLRFLAIVSHELRTPLTSIQGFASTLLAPDVEWSASDQLDFIRTINDEADKLRELIDELLDLSRIESGRLSIEPASEKLQELVPEDDGALKRLAPGHRLEINIPDDLPPVIVDARRLRQVLSNLVGNAAKYTPDGARIGIHAERTGEHVVLSVSDEGPGIPPEHHESVFEAFQRLEGPSGARVKGAGLGLAICKGIVEAHGGRIWIDEGASPGTTVRFTLPLA